MPNAAATAHQAQMNIPFGVAVWRDWSMDRTRNARTRSSTLPSQSRAPASSGQSQPRLVSTGPGTWMTRVNCRRMPSRNRVALRSPESGLLLDDVRGPVPLLHPVPAASRDLAESRLASRTSTSISRATP